MQVLWPATTFSVLSDLDLSEFQFFVGEAEGFGHSLEGNLAVHYVHALSQSRVGLAGRVVLVRASVEV